MKYVKWLPWLLGAGTFIYYAFMAVRDYSWIFVSSDSAVWLAASTQWLVPPPYGGPVYLLLGHLVYTIFPSNLPLAMTILLSSLPAAITVVLVYNSVLHLTQRPLYAIIGATVLAGSAVFTAEGTVTVYHVLGAAFIAAAFYTYLKGHRYLPAVLLGIGAGVHVIVIPIALLWLIVEIADRSGRQWLKPALVCLGTIAMCYSIILILMYLPTPRLLAGGLNYESVRDYFTKTSQAIIGEISVFEAPRRLLFTLELLLMSFGLALIPIRSAFRKPLSKPILLCLATIMFSLWYFITCMDAMTWTYLTFAAPAVAVLVGVGLNRMSRVHTYIVAAGVVVFLVLNLIFMNAAVLTNQDPAGRRYLNQLDALPEGSIVVTAAGSLSLGLFYHNATEPDHNLLPLVYPYLDYPDFHPSEDYYNYLTVTYNINLDHTSTLSAVQSALDQSIPVYYTKYQGPADPLEPCFNTESPQDTSRHLARVISLTGLPPSPAVIMEDKR